ncbi:hypothetical protein Mal4_54030 [Maioricimonas rarisocia]|uniref:Uncharacterized protein n=1 Tax=Maioricimonas rarisocia TaxID=2528026 RepID=A0A517ZEZ1_9PLAN|nr:hypothetical protein [Maioricimonas rarisocia]QDU41038.1 hypothetical protein Mal4_54030 [Maioricimonas rarisocia]
MQIAGCQPATNVTRTITLPRGDGSTLNLTIQPLSLGFHRRLRERGIVAPAPPRRVARDAAGRPIRDESGLAVMLADDHDPQFLAEIEQYHQRVALLAIPEALAADPQVRFEAQAPSSDAAAAAWMRYADDLNAELEAAGFTTGDLVRLCTEICRLSNLLDEQLTAAQAGFSQPPEDRGT